MSFITKMPNSNELNDTVKLTIKPSGIHGVGVFAIRDIKEGENLYTHGSPEKKMYKPKDLKGLNPEVKALILQRWLLAEKGGTFLNPHDDVWLNSFLNHSDTPNLEKRTDLALKDIKKGEEITINYAPQVTPNFDK